MHLIDTHCHIDVEDFDTDRNQVLARCYASGIMEMIVPAVDRQGWQKLLQLCSEQPGLYPALGLHPVYVAQHQPEDVHALEQVVAEEKLCAIGEIGLDYYLDQLDRGQQQQLFEAQLCIARDAGLPVVLHVRRSCEQVLQTLKKTRVRGGIAHAFNGSLQQARQFIELGFKLGFGGTMTYDGSRRIHALARELPLDAIVLETDAPDMVVASHRGERNSPEYLTECLQALAGLREEDPEYIADITTRNAHTVLNIP